MELSGDEYLFWDTAVIVIVWSYGNFTTVALTSVGQGLLTRCQGN